MIINKDDLIEMMVEFWIISPNEECHIKTIEFCKKNAISLDDVNIDEDYNY